MAAPAFAPEKSPDAFRTISEVATLLDMPQHVLRFWESRFSQIKPVKRAGGRRYYRPEDVDLLTGIRTLLYGEGLTIRGVQKVLKERGQRHVANIGRGGAPVAPPEPVLEKIFYIEKPKKPRPTHLRAVPQPMSLPFFDEPEARMETAPPVKASVEIEKRFQIEERARLMALLSELNTLKQRLRVARKAA